MQQFPPIPPTATVTSPPPRNRYHRRSEYAHHATDDAKYSNNAYIYICIHTSEEINISNICTVDETGDVVVGDEDAYVVGNEEVSVQISDVLREVITSPT